MIDVHELAKKPIGSKELQEEADITHRLVATGQKARPNPELAETIKRTSKKWLPAGKRPTRGPEIDAAEKAFYERQTDLEDAVVAAGGSRGSVR